MPDALHEGAQKGNNSMAHDPQDDRDNPANQLNDNNDAYWQSQGYERLDRPT